MTIIIYAVGIHNKELAADRFVSAAKDIDLHCY